MNESEKASIRKNTVLLVNDLELEPVLDYLQGRRTITAAQYEELMPTNKAEKRNKVRDFLGTITRRGPAAFGDFVDSLIESGQRHLADAVSPDRAAAAAGKRDTREQVMLPVAATGTLVNENETSAENEESMITVAVKATDVRTVDSHLRDNQVYRMTLPCRGRVLLINNEKFAENSESKELLRDRQGSILDAMNISSLFTALHFEVVQYHDQTAEEMKALIKSETDLPENANYGMFVLVILSHGEKGAVYGVDKVPLKILEIKQLLGSSSFKHMAGKPKFILLQACQGVKHDGKIQHDGGTTMETDSLPPAVAETRPEFADMLIAYSTSEGYVSYRNVSLGSWFIRAVVKVFMKKAWTDHIVDMLTEVRRDVCGVSTANGYRQGSYDENHLHKKLYFLPGWTGPSS